MLIVDIVLLISHPQRKGIIAMSWKESKDAGQQAFVNENYSEALNQYTKAIDLLTSEEQSSSNNNTKEHQVLLSNVIACRLKIGGVDMATDAVEDSKQVCICIDMFAI